MIHDEIEGIKHRNVEIEACVESLAKNINTYYDRTENGSDMSLLMKQMPLESLLVRSKN